MSTPPKRMPPPPLPQQPEPGPGTEAAAIIAGEQMTRWQALRAAGWWKGVDFLFTALLMAAWITVFFWWLFGDPAASRIIGVALLNMVLTQIWMIILAFRCSHFVLLTRADINLLPAAAARIVIGYYSGKGPGKT